MLGAGEGGTGVGEGLGPCPRFFTVNECITLPSFENVETIKKFIYMAQMNHAYRMFSLSNNVLTKRDLTTLEEEDFHQNNFFPKF